MKNNSKITHDGQECDESKELIKHLSTFDPINNNLEQDRMEQKNCEENCKLYRAI